MKSCKIGDFEIFWLNGGEFELDGGTMFGVVPKSLWAKKYPVDEDTPLLFLEENAYRENLKNLDSGDRT